ncbi:sulfurtransferase TusA [Buchnera aphidicola]|uniref:sulfurtransferase TusA n=1 Tax=Buchnera aphidicola TaxID=9 RepID=UPI0031B6B64D
MNITKKKLDLRNLRCPETVMLLRKKARNMNFGEYLLVISNDFSSKRDIPKFCQFMKYKLIKIEHKNCVDYHLLKK